MPESYAFLTVAHAIDFGLLRLQATSMALFCPPALIKEILVVENFDAGAAADWRGALLAAYKQLAPLVRFIAPADIARRERLSGDAPMPPHIGGWWRQQALKIAVANVVTADRYVVLDAKTQLVRPLTRGFLDSANGQPRPNGYSFEAHPLKDALIRTLDYLGVDPAPMVAKFTRTSTPFTMVTAVSRDIVSHIEEREHKPFATAFLDLRLTEFFLYSGYLRTLGTLETTYDMTHDMTQPHCAQIWGYSQESECRSAVARAALANACPFLSVHRMALANMDVLPRVLVAEFWRDAGLFASVEDAVAFTLAPNGL